jgi:hypothetical protein
MAYSDALADFVLRLGSDSSLLQSFKSDPNRPLKKSAVATPVPKWADFLSALVELRKSARARHRRSRREMIFEILFQRPAKTTLDGEADLTDEDKALLLDPDPAKIREAVSGKPLPAGVTVVVVVAVIK